MNREPPATTEDKSAPPRCGSRFPLLWLLVPQIFAFSFFGNVLRVSESVALRLLLAGTVFLAVAAIVVARERSRPDSDGNVLAGTLWRISFAAAAFFFFGAWRISCEPPFADWSGKSARDAECVLKIERNFSASEKNFSGFARAEEIATDSASSLAGTRIWYALPKTLCAEAGLDDAPAEGARLRVSGVFSAPDSVRESASGFFDFLRRERVSAMFSRAESVEIVPDGNGAFPRVCASAKNFFLRRLAEISNGSGTEFSRRARILGAMLFGERALLLPDQKRNFLLTGTMHVFAVSGLHISALCAGALFLLRLCRVPRVPARIAALAVLWFFVQIVGAPPSAMRAWMMAAVVFAGGIFGRGNAAFHALIFSAFVALTVNPLLLDDVGFRLSYFVVAAILLYGVPAAEKSGRLVDFNRWIPESQLSFARKKAARLAQIFTACVCVSFSAFLAGAPISVSVFGICSFLSLAANVFLIPSAIAALWLGACALAVSCVPVAGTLFGKCLFFAAEIPLAATDFLPAALSGIPASPQLAFPRTEFGAFGGVMMFLLFFFGERLAFFRERPLLRFALPPFALGIFLLLFAY